MGKGVLIFVMASSLSLGAMYMAGTDNDIASAQEEADYKDELLARETAQSAYNIVSSKVRRSFDSYRGAYTDLDYGKAKYDIGATEADDGTVTIIAVGKYGDHEYEIVGSVSRSTETVIDAITVSAPVTDVEIKNDASISGVDTAPGGTSVHGILATNSTAYDALMEVSDHVTGKGGSGDIVQGDPHIELSNIRASIKGYLGTGRADISEDETELDEGNNIGSSGSPAVLVVNGNLVLRDDFEGYGALFVEGDLTMEDDAVWHGLVYVAGSSSAFLMKNQAEIDGAVIIDGTSSADDIPDPIDNNDRGLLGGHFDVDIFDKPNSSKEIYHEHQYDDKYDVKGVDLLQSGCKSGGLCWDSLMGGENNDVRIETMNSSSSGGSYELVVGATTYTGSSTETLDLVVDPRDISSFSYSFDSLCSLAISSPSSVQDDPDSRNGAFTIRVYKENGNSLLYEISIYHHWKSKDGDGHCAGAVVPEAPEWVSANGSSYSGDDAQCVNEDDNDNYTDWTQRESKWGKRQRRGSDKSSKKSDKSDKSSKKSDKSDKSSKKSDKSDKSSKKSDKSDKSSKKSDKSSKSEKGPDGDVFWTSNSQCADSNENGGSGDAPSITMEDDVRIAYNSTALKRLKSMLQAFDMSDGIPVARRLSQTPYKDGNIINATVDGVQEVVEKTGTRLENDSTIKTARNLLGK
jgi:hypothetical protein